ncbi:MAG: hypothetical protein SOZ83_06100 [Sphaerochaetaceae bacterium]|nr:hypothetical protein [Spirochaetales bacterium]MDY3769151.1 hypothetical protein [Sphaerochaetaceae bacterium]MDY5968251.1 hypothetical protein [Sphaerochaetaceae bacterium]
MNEETKIKFATISNVVIVCMVLYSTVMALISDGWGFFQYYTQLSNLYGGITASFALHYYVHKIKNPKLVVPEWCKHIRYSSTCCLTLTFLVVVFFLAPQKGGWNGYKTMMFQGISVFTHLLTPILSIVSFLCFEEKALKPLLRYAVIPTILYAVVLVILNALKVLTGPYFFLRVYDQALYMTFIWCIVVIGIDFAIAFGLSRINHTK